MLEAAPSSSTEDNYLHARTIAISNEFGLGMIITIEINQKNEYMVRIDFFNKTTRNKIDVDTLQEDDLLDLITKYRLYVNQLSENANSFSSKDTLNIKSKLTSIKNVTKIKVIAQRLFQELRRMDVYTIDGPRDIVFARTTIELDADIVTIIRPELIAYMNTQKNSYLVLLHTCNLYLANHLFVHRINKFSAMLKTLTDTVRIISISVWLIPNLSYLLISSHHLISGDLVAILVQIINLIGIPAIMAGIIPKIIGYIVKYHVIRILQL